MRGIIAEPRCNVCKSPHLSSIDAFTLQGMPRAEIAAKFGDVSVHSLKRHKLQGHVKERMAAIAAYEPGPGAPLAAGDVKDAQRQLAATLSSLTARAEKIMSAAEAQYERFKDSPNAADVAQLLRVNLQALHEIGDLAGLYKKDAPHVDNRQIHLSGLTQDQLTTLIDGLRGSLA